MPDGYVRHDLVRPDPEAWAAWLRTRPDLDGVPHLPDWARVGRPLVVRRRVPGEDGARVPLGLPLPPADGKRRIGLALDPAQLAPMRPPTLAEAAPHAPAAWRATLEAFTALGARFGVTPRPFGGLLWQAVTGLGYLTAASDLDMLWPCAGPVPSALLDAIAAIADAAPMRIDGEALLPDGTGLHWRELRDAPSDGAVLAKTVEGVALRPVSTARAETTP